MSELWRRFRRNRLAVLGLGAIVLFVILGAGAPWIAPYDPMFDMNVDALLGPPTAAHWLGTDRFGRDVLSRIIHGARISLQVAVAAVSLALAAGTVIGICGGYFGGRTDTLLSRSMDVLMSLPDILLALALMAILQAGIGSLMLAIGIVYTPIFARVARGAALQVRGSEFVEAARAAGLGHARILLRHILPNITAPLAVQTTLSLAFAVLAEAALSFLGLGVEPDAPSWGMMLRDGKARMELAWWVAVFPGAAITAVVLAFNLLGDGLRDALDPRLKT
jgi:peptide/nickel transport system permease protein